MYPHHVPLQKPGLSERSPRRFSSILEHKPRVVQLMKLRTTFPMLRTMYAKKEKVKSKPRNDGLDQLKAIVYSWIHISTNSGKSS